MSLVAQTRGYTHAFVIVGDNDVKNLNVNLICQKFKEFSRSVWPTEVKFAGHMRRKDLPVHIVAYNNMFLRNRLGPQLKSSRLIRREDFDDNCKFHFDKFGEGYRHMGALILSVLREFCEQSVNSAFPA